MLGPALNPGGHCQGPDFATDHSPLSPEVSVPLQSPLSPLCISFSNMMWCETAEISNIHSSLLIHESVTSSQKPLGFIRHDFPCCCSSGSWIPPSHDQDCSQLPHSQAVFVSNTSSSRSSSPTDFSITSASNAFQKPPSQLMVHYAASFKSHHGGLKHNFANRKENKSITPFRVSR